MNVNNSNTIPGIMILYPNSDSVISCNKCNGSLSKEGFATNILTQNYQGYRCNSCSIPFYVLFKNKGLVRLSNSSINALLN